MDDNLETPDPLAKGVPVPVLNGGEDEESSGEEDVPDWTKFASAAASSRTVIPKRGDKEFEPAPGGPTDLQSYSLNRSRNAMFDALRVERGTSSKSMSYGIWLPSFARVEVTNARGNSFVTLGHQWAPPNAAAHSTKAAESSKRITNKLCLLPEEALYLIERGSMFCWKQIDATVILQSDDLPGSPMSVQQAFAEMIGSEDLTMERYQVFAYLKRLGYTVMRAQTPASSPLYPMPSRRVKHSLLASVSGYVASWLRRCRSWMATFMRNWWWPFQFGWPTCTTYPSIFSKLRIIPSGHSTPLWQPYPITQKPSPFSNDVQPQPPSPYKIFFNAWKPSTPWRKTSVPSPDFEIVVVNANKTLLPSLREFAEVFRDLPRQPPPLPRKRLKAGQTATTQPPMPRTYLYSRVKALLGLAAQPKQAQQPRPNLFINLKAGTKSLIIAAVDGGSISFIRFSEGNFAEWPAI